MTEPEAVIREALMRLDASRRGSINYAVYEAKKDGLAALAALVAERDKKSAELEAVEAALHDLETEHRQAVAERDRYRDALRELLEGLGIELDDARMKYIAQVDRDSYEAAVAALAVSTP